jgi:hypothetical protein
MIIPLGTPFKGATHCAIYQLTFDLDACAAFVRIRFGADSGDGVTLAPDPDIRERCCVFEGGDYDELYGSVDGTPVAVALVARDFAEKVDPPAPPPEPEPDPETLTPEQP